MTRFWNSRILDGQGRALCRAYLRIIGSSYPGLGRQGAPAKTQLGKQGAHRQLPSIDPWQDRDRGLFI
jgi:hypothetical protein